MRSGPGVAFLTPEETLAALRAAKDRSVRDWAMVLLAYRHGLRTSEVCGLRLGDVDLKDGAITIQRLKGSLKTVQPLYAHRGQPLLDEVGALIRKAASRKRHSNGSPEIVKVAVRSEKFFSPANTRQRGLILSITARRVQACSVLSPSLLTCLHDFIPSMALKRAVEISQGRGLSGMPGCSQDSRARQANGVPNFRKRNLWALGKHLTSLSSALYDQFESS